MASKSRRAGDASPHHLVIVESPAKARTIAGYLGDGYLVESSIGHVRDLPENAAEIPAKYKKEGWARLGVNVDRDFAPLYVVSSGKRSQVKKLKDLLAGADALYLATDEDREGEAIAWHLREVLAPTVPVRRMVFHEITRDAIRRAVDHPRDINLRLVDAQETRRVLDRLYGYEVSPVLWKKVMPKLSAGRVQSVATRLVVERERERIAFRPAHYWDLQAVFAPYDTGAGPAAGAPNGRDGEPASFAAGLVAVDGRRVASGRDFGPDGQLRTTGVSDAREASASTADNGNPPSGRRSEQTSGVLHLDEETARGLAERLADASFGVRSVERKPYRRSPYAPFRTTTMQQEASRKLGFSAKYAMQIAQRLYENGHITYMRTDSITLSEAAIAAARAQARQLYGDEYVPDKPRVYRSKVKNAQEAHEAIRPTGDTFRTPAETGLTGDEFRLYELVWKRTVASEMKDAVGQSITVRVAGTSSAGEDAEFSATGKVITFPGFLKAYVEGSDDPEAELDDMERRLPDLAENDRLAALELEASGHSTRPPARYTEASLVRELEEREIGRPSTYATIIGTILDRGYVFRKGTALVPSWLAFAVVNLLEQHFGHLVDYEFTARMEDVLDAVARGEAESVPWLARFYFGGNGDAGLKDLVSDLGEIDAREVSSFPIDESGIVVRVGRYGTYLERGEERANILDNEPPDELTPERAEELLARPSGERFLGTDPDTGRAVVAKSGRYGPYVSEVIEDGQRNGRGAVKPRTASLLRSMSLDTVTLDDALALLRLPRVVGELDGEEVTARTGRYGPYLKKGKDTRSLETEEQVFTVSLEEARDLFAKPKSRRAAAAAPLRELGDDPGSGRPVVVKNGRFGPYVTDGETNASLRQGDTVESVSLQRAAELLADRRARAGTGGRGGSGSGSRGGSAKGGRSTKGGGSGGTGTRGSSRRRTGTRR